MIAYTLKHLIICRILFYLSYYIVVVIELREKPEIWLFYTKSSTRECSHYLKRADSEQIFRQTRRISAGILAVFQGNATQYDGKSARIQPLSGSVNTP